MDNLIANAMIEKTKRGRKPHVTGTKLHGAMEIDGAKLNYPVAEAIMTLKEVEKFGKGVIEISAANKNAPADSLAETLRSLGIPETVIFGQGSIQFPSLMYMESEGYLFEDGELIIYIDSKERSVDQVLTNKKIDDSVSNSIKQALILLDYQKDITNLNLKQQNISALSGDDFSALKEKFLSHLSGILKPKLVQTDDIEVSEYAAKFQAEQQAVKTKHKEGIVFVKNELSIFFDFNPKTQYIETIIANTPLQDSDSQQPLLQALILLEMQQNITNLNLKQSALQALSLPFIENKDSEEARQLAKLARTFEIMLSDGNLKPLDFETKAFKIISVDNELVEMGILDQPKTKVPETAVVEQMELPTDKPETLIDESLFEVVSDAPPLVEDTPKTETVQAAEVPIAKENPAFNQSGGSLEASSLVRDLSLALKALAVPAAAPLKAESLPPIAIDEKMLRKERPLFYDDAWVSDYLKTFELSDHTIDIVVKFRKLQRDILDKAFVLDVEAKSAYRGYQEPIEFAIACALTDINLVLKGEAGSGKTTLIQTISSLLNLPLFTINGSDESNIETIVGFKDIVDGQIVFKEGRLTRAMRAGGIFYIDEVNMVRPNVLAIVNGAIDHRKQLYNEFTGERINGNKNFRCMASMNEDYEDTRQVNRATLDRSMCYEMTYMTVEQLKKMLKDFDPGYTEFQRDVLELDDLSRTDIQKLANIATALQQGAKNEQFSPEVASIRNILHLLRATRLLPFERAVMGVVYKYSKEEREAILAALSNVDGIGIQASNILPAM